MSVLKNAYWKISPEKAGLLYFIKMVVFVIVVKKKRKSGKKGVVEKGRAKDAGVLGIFCSTPGCHTVIFRQTTRDRPFGEIFEIECLNCYQSLKAVYLPCKECHNPVLALFPLNWHRCAYCHQHHDQVDLQQLLETCK